MGFQRNAFALAHIELSSSRLTRPSQVNYPALLAPSCLTAVGHSLRTGLFPQRHCVPRDPMLGRGPASSYRPAVGVGALLMPPTPTDDEDCPAGLIPGVLTLYPEMGTELNRSRSSFPSTGCDTLASQEPVYWWLLLSSACARATVGEDTSRAV